MFYQKVDFQVYFGVFVFRFLTFFNLKNDINKLPNQQQKALNCLLAWPDLFYH